MKWTKAIKRSGDLDITGAICLRTAAPVNGWGCSSFAARTVPVNGASLHVR